MSQPTPQPSYRSRPADETFKTFDELIASAEHDQQHSAERTYNLKDLQVMPEGDDLRLVSPKGSAAFTHHSFGQLCRTLQSPAAYLRDELKPTLAAACLNYRISEQVPGTSAKLLVKANGMEPLLRACSSTTYGRAWDADLLNGIKHNLIGRDDRWKMETGFRGDRDLSVCITNKQSVINDPSVTDQPLDQIMYRGVLLRNSEVGLSSIVIETVIFRARCKNLMLWSALSDSTFRRRHVGSAVTRDAIRKIVEIAYKWAAASPAKDEALIRTLISHEIAITRPAVIDELKALGATVEQANAAYDRCVATEAVSPRSFWGIAQGLTRLSQDSGYQDSRYELDQLAAKVLARGARLVAA